MKRISALLFAFLLFNIFNSTNNVFSQQRNQNSGSPQNRHASAGTNNESNTPNQNQSVEERERNILGNAANAIDINETAEARKLREKLREIVRQMNEVHNGQNTNNNQSSSQQPAAAQTNNTPPASGNAANASTAQPVQPASSPAEQTPAAQETEQPQTASYDTPFNKSPQSIQPVNNSIVELFIKYYTTIGRKYLEKAFENMQKYYPVIAKKLQEHNLPLELAILPIIESAYSEYARSSSGALGLWQLMPFTAKINGCKITEYVDERMEIMKATEAAIKFILHLKATFNNWDLILAAYNGGGNYLLQQMRKYRSDNFWEFSKKDGFSQQTMEYVPRFYAVYHVMLNLKKYQFSPMDFKRKVYFETVETPRGTGIDRIAAVLDLQPFELKELNPQLLQNIIPHDTEMYSLKVPNGFGKIYIARKHLIQPVTLPAAAVQFVHQKIIIRHGDTLNLIAQRYRVKKNDIVRINYLRDPNRLSIGMPLLLPIKVRVQNNSETAGSSITTPARQPSASPVRPAPTERRIHPRPVVPQRRTHIAAQTRINPTPASNRNSVYHQRRNRLLLMIQRPRKTSVVYKVRRGDTVVRIAKVLNTSQEKVIAANNGSTFLIAGRVLKIYR